MGAASRIEPATFRSAAKRSTDYLSLSREYEVLIHSNFIVLFCFLVLTIW